MKTYLKTLGRMFKKHITRFLSIILIVLITVGFISGLGTSCDKINYSLNDYYKAKNVSDFIIKSREGGFSDEDVDKVKRILSDKGEAVVQRGMSVEAEIDGELTRLYFFEDFDDVRVNKYDTVDSIESDAEHVAYFAAKSNKIKGYELGQEIELDFVDILDRLAAQNSDDNAGLDEDYKNFLESALSPVTVTATAEVQTPLTIALDGEMSYLNPGDTEPPDTIVGIDDYITVDNILYMPYDVVPEINTMFGSTGKALTMGDLYVSLGDRTLFNCFSGRYKNYIDDKSEEIIAEFGKSDAENGEEAQDRVSIISLYQNFSLNSLKVYSDKVSGLSWVLMAVFLFVTVLVVFSNMARLMEEERSQIACLRTLGYSAFKIIFKYALFALVATGIGGVIAYFVGEWLASFIYYVFNFSFVMPPMSSYFSLTFFVAVFFIIVAAILFATLFSGFKMTSETPANLLRPKPPKSGKKVILERIPLFWNRLSFKYKSTVRNVLRYKSRFLMTVIAVAIAMGLIMAGLGLLDLSLFGDLKSSAITAISIVIIAFAGLLTATVIYTLTNINISERNRELATLMVLGYYDGEVTGYIYREVYIDTGIGILLGYPFSALFIWAVFKMIGLGTLGGISWFMWLIAPVVVLLFTSVVALMLRHKMVKIDMNESLKAIE